MVGYLHGQDLGGYQGSLLAGLLDGGEELVAGGCASDDHLLCRHVDVDLFDAFNEQKKK